MSWAARRRFIILSLIGGVAGVFLLTLLIVVIYEPPTCVDGTRNQGETGVDCGGPCTYLCTAEMYAPTVLFTKALSNPNGRTDVISLVENKNAAADAKNVPYKITLYNKDKILLGEASGVTDLPARERTPIYVPGLTFGKQTIATAFLTIDSDTFRWQVPSADDRVLPIVSSPRPTGTVSAPRVEATFTNNTSRPMQDIKAVAVVYDVNKEVLAASQTIIPLIPGQGEAKAIFTWNAPFAATSTQIEVIPVVPVR